MKCPACQCTLTAVTLSDVIVNVCRGGCAGIWFDRGALRTFDEPAEGAGQALLALAGDPHVSVDLTQRRRCPICPDSVMMRHFFSAKRAITVDECPTCGGVWLDSGELERIRAEYDSEGSRRLAARGGFEEILVADRMALFGKQLEEQLPYRHVAVTRRSVYPGRVPSSAGSQCRRCRSPRQVAGCLDCPVGVRLLP